MSTAIRIFKHGSAELPNPNPILKPEDVRDIHAINHPELATATLSAPKMEGGRMVYTYEAKAGVKG